MLDQLLSFAGKVFFASGGIGNDLRKEITQIASDLHLYGNVLYGQAPVKAREASEVFRKRAAELKGILNQIRYYWWARLGAGLPPRADVEKAIGTLTRLSNQVVASSECIDPLTIFNSVEAVKRFLQIR